MTLFIYLCQAGKNCLHLFRLFLLDTLLEKFLEDMMVTQPAPIRPHLQNKQIVLLDCFDQILPIALAHYGLA